MNKFSQNRLGQSFSLTWETLSILKNLRMGRTHHILKSREANLVLTNGAKSANTPSLYGISSLTPGEARDHCIVHCRIRLV